MAKLQAEDPWHSVDDLVKSDYPDADTICTCSNTQNIDNDCPVDDDDDCPADDGGDSLTCDVATYGSSMIDNITLNYHHFADDYKAGVAEAACGSCGGGAQGGPELTSLHIERRHRFRDMIQHGSFGPAVFTNFDTHVTFYAADDGIQADLFDPRSEFKKRLVDGLSGDNQDGLFSDLRNKAVKQAELYNAAGALTTVLPDAKTFKVIGHDGNSRLFEVVDMSGSPAANYTAYWKFDDASGISASDEAGSVQGTLVGDTVWVSGVSGASDDKAVEFTNTTGHINVPNLSQHLSGTCSLAFWIKTTQTGSNKAWEAPGVAGVEQLGGEDDIFWGILDGTGRIRLQVGDAEAIVSTDPVNDGSWHHVVLTRNAQSGWIGIHVDGLYNSEIQSPATGIIGQSFSSLGRIEDTAGTPQSLVGALDDVRIYDRVISPTEITNLSRQGNYVGRLIAITDRAGYQTDLTYHYNEGIDDAAIAISPERLRQIDSVTDAYGRTANFHYRPTQVAGSWVVEQIDLPSGESIDYTYGDDLRLTKVSLPDNSESTIEFGVDVATQLTTVAFNDVSAQGIHRKKTAYFSNNLVLESGNLGAENVWNQSSLMVRIVRNAADEVTYMSMNDPNSTNPNRKIIYEGGNRMKQIDGQWEIRYYDNGWEISTGDDGKPELSGNMESTFAFAGAGGYSIQTARHGTYPQIRDATGRVIDIEYDDDTFPILKTFSDGTTEVTSYNDLKQVVRFEDRLNRVTLSSYDQQGNLLERKEGILNTGTDAVPNDVQQPEFAVTTNAYYPAGHANQHRLQYRYDANQNRTEYIYDANQFLVQINEPDDDGAGYHLARSMTYDSAGRLATSTDAMKRKTSYAYDACDRLTRVIYDDSSSEETLYGAPGSGNENLVVARKDRNGNVSTIAYDIQGRVTEEVGGRDNVGPAGSILSGYTAPSVPLSASVKSCTYLYGTQLRQSCTVNGERTDYTYDYQNRMVASTVHPRQGKSLTNSVTYLKNLVFSRTDIYGRKTFNAYRESDKALIRRIQATHPSPAGEPTSYQDVLDRVRGGDHQNPLTNGDYLIRDSILDAEGQTIASIDPRGIVDAVVYDSRGRAFLRIESATTLPPYNEAAFDPTDDSQLHALAAKTQTIYDAVGNVLEVRSPRWFDAGDTDAFGKASTTRTFTSRNLLASETRAAGADDYIAGDPLKVRVTRTMTYNLDRTLFKQTDFRGNETENIWSPCCAGRLLSTIDPTNLGSSRQYDHHGNVTVTDHSKGSTLAQTTTRYDSRHRLVARTTWLVAQTGIDPINPPIAGGGENGDPDLLSGGEPVGLTTRVLYDESLIDSDGLDAGVSVDRLDGNGTFTVNAGGLLAKLSAAGITPDVGCDFSARATINPEEEISISISDGNGRNVISGIVADDASGTPITWNITLHDTVANVDGFGNCLVTKRINAVGDVTQSFTDAAGRTLQSIDALGKISTRDYDANGNTLASRDANGVGQDCLYDTHDRDTQCTDTQALATADPYSTSRTYDKAGNVVSKTDAKGNVETCKFDPLNRQYLCTDRIGAQTNMRYDQDNHLLSLSDGENQVTSYTYDAVGNKLTETYPDHVSSSSIGDAGYGIINFTYDEMHRTLVTTDQQGDTRTMAYDLAGRLLSKTYAGHASGPLNGVTDTDSFTYDNASRQLSAVSGRFSNTVAYTYDDAGRKETESLTVGGQTYTTTSHYDDAGRLTSLDYPDGTVTARTYTQRSQLHQIKRDGVTIDTRSYDDGGRMTGSVYNNGVSESRVYNDDNTLSSITFAGASIGDLSYDWDINKNKTSEGITGTMSGFGFDVGTAGYDDEDRLVNWQRDDTALNQSWNLSQVGDWNTFTENASVQNRTHGPTHEILTAAGQAAEHDAKGNQTLIPAVLTTGGTTNLALRWDFENKLLGADTDGDTIDDVTYQFDAIGRRVARTTSTGTTVFVQSGQQTIADYALSAVPASPTYTYFYGSYIDEPVMRAGTGGLRYYHRGQQFSITALTDGGGNVTERYAYDAYGTPTITDAAGTTLTTSADNNRYTYTGREHDEDLGLYHYRARMYDSVAGRFCSRDPIGYYGSPFNLYEYVGGKPIRMIDPSGKWPWSPCYECNGVKYDPKTEGCCSGVTVYTLDSECCEGGNVVSKVPIWICTRPLGNSPKFPFVIPIPGCPTKTIGHSYVCCAGSNVKCFGKQALIDEDGDFDATDVPVPGDPIPVEPFATGTCKRKLVCPSAKKSKCDNPVYTQDYDLLCREGKGTNCHEWACRNTD